MTETYCFLDILLEGKRNHKEKGDKYSLKINKTYDFNIIEEFENCTGSSLCGIAHLECCTRV